MTTENSTIVSDVADVKPDESTLFYTPASPPSPPIDHLALFQEHIAGFLDEIPENFTIGELDEMLKFLMRAQGEQDEDEDFKFEPDMEPDERQDVEPYWPEFLPASKE